MSRKQPAFKRKKKNRISIIVLIAVIAAFCTYFIIKGITLSNTRDNLQTDINNINEKIEEENQRSEDLKEQETYMHTKKYAEEVAKDVLGYVYEDEIIFKPDK